MLSLFHVSRVGAVTLTVLLLVICAVVGSTIILTAEAHIASLSQSSPVMLPATSSGGSLIPLGTTATPTPPSCGAAWRQDPSTIAGAMLYGVTALNATDVWAVGMVNYQTLTEHWDGTSWTVVPSPNVGTDANFLKAVAAVATDNVWAVGFYYDGSGTYTLIEHWDGSQWHIVLSVDPDANTNTLSGVAAVSANDVWSVGSYSTNMAQTLTEHWDGTSWTVVPSPNVGTDANFLKAVAAVATDNVWAVGVHTQAQDNHALSEHWDGGSWSIVSDAVSIISNLYGVVAFASDDVWAVGYVGKDTLIEHWDGAMWSVVSSPNPNGINTLEGVAAASSTDIWAVGNSWDGSASSTLLVHWDGTQWTQVPGPNPDPSASELLGVAVLPSGEAWSVGIAGGSLIVHYSDPCITPSVTPSPSNTATITPTMPPTATPSVPPTATPIVCTIQFTDVPVGSTFHDNILCLACQGLISGYPCGGPGEPCDPNNNSYFRPGSDVTRGQLSKIVSNAAGFNDTQTVQMFEDVPVGSTFFDFIGRLASRGLINGYPCGGAGEPCGPNNLPYFRPSNTASRGQIAKIDANAAGYNDTPTGQQFEDVLPGSTYYVFAYELSTRGIMSGYPCGGVGEPCGPNNLPYFRTNNNATRGQTSKIVGNTFFPHCAIAGTK